MPGSPIQVRIEPVATVVPLTRGVRRDQVLTAMCRYLDVLATPHRFSTRPAARPLRSPRRSPLRRLGLAFALLAGIVPVAAEVTSVAAASPAGASSFVAVAPTRLADTRPGSAVGAYTQMSERMIRVQVAGRAGVPIGAAAAVLNITAVDTQGAGWVTAFPAGEPVPTASSLNVDVAGRVISNLATVRLGADGSVDIAASASMHLVVDVVGAYVPRTAAVSSGRLETLAQGAVRAVDTRDTRSPLAAGETRAIDLSIVGVPADASAVVVSLVATEAQVGFWTAFPSGGDRPLASSMNIDTAAQTRSAQAIVALPVGARSFQLFSQSGGHLVVDVAGWFTGATSPVSTDGMFVPVSPQRVLDTRNEQGLAPWGGTTVEFGTGSPNPSGIAAVALNVTATDPWYLGYVTAHPAGVARPASSNLNVTALDQIVANHAIVRAGSRGLSVFTQSGTHLVADVAGWYLGTPEPSTLPQQRRELPRATPARQIAARGAGVDTEIGTHPNIDVTINSGRAGLWMGSGDLGVTDHNVYFAHRTSHGGEFRTIHQLTVGSRFSVLGNDGREYLYLVTRQDIIVPRSAELLKVIDQAGPITVTLVACHPPGSVRYRLAVSGRLIGIAP